MKFFALAIRAHIFKDSVSTDISATAGAIISPDTTQKPAPAVFAQTSIAFTNTLPADGAYRRPEKLIQTLKSKSDTLF
jgi:hypothetical protein